MTGHWGQHTRVCRNQCKGGALSLVLGPSLPPLSDPSNTHHSNGDRGQISIIHLYNDRKVRFFSLLSLLHCNIFGKDKTLLLVSKKPLSVIKEVKTEKTVSITLALLFGKK